MALTALNSYTVDTDEALQTGLSRLGEAFGLARPAVVLASQKLMQRLSRRIDAVVKMIGIALEGIDVELTRLKIKSEPDVKTHDVSRKLVDLLKREND
jgi:hypothetical protein